MKLKWIPFLILLLAAPSLYSQEADHGEYDVLAKTVENKILDKNKIKIDRLKVLHRDGVIYLEGVAKLFGSRYLAEEIASDVEGVKSVENEIAVVSGEISDLEIQGNLISKIRSRMQGTPFDLISLKVSHGFVTLLGVVRDASLRQDTFDEAIWVPGVRDVRNQIKLASVAAGDERLRQEIYRRLRNEYQLYFIGKDPSIIILVEGARVTLVGNVHSNVDRERIGTMVRSLRGVLSVENQLASN